MKPIGDPVQPELFASESESRATEEREKYQNFRHAFERSSGAKRRAYQQERHQESACAQDQRQCDHDQHGHRDQVPRRKPPRKVSAARHGCGEDHLGRAGVKIAQRRSGDDHVLGTLGSQFGIDGDSDARQRLLIQVGADEPRLAVAGQAPQRQAEDAIVGDPVRVELYPPGGKPPDPGL